ncbi:hypothetical protein B0H66DRAFT_587552 [Apodospora peruviana]|uniref:Uncharacterized protein n=1 Tax=Apodospora peruviana TaxID=516989 RepID=A0AAE0IU64_9PEZI|nr:hypothetical protein B0H66DRAFT_587552 [Apodospora peruviana]
MPIPIIRPRKHLPASLATFWPCRISCMHYGGVLSLNDGDGEEGPSSSYEVGDDAESEMNDSDDADTVFGKSVMAAVILPQLPPISLSLLRYGTILTTMQCPINCPKIRRSETSSRRAFVAPSQPPRLTIHKTWLMRLDSNPSNQTAHWTQEAYVRRDSHKWESGIQIGGIQSARGVVGTWSKEYKFHSNLAISQDLRWPLPTNGLVEDFGDRVLRNRVEDIKYEILLQDLWHVATYQYTIPFSTSRPFAWYNLSLRELLLVCIGRRHLALNCLNPALLRLVVIECPEKNNNCDVHQAVIRDAIVGVELFEGGVEAMDVVGKWGKRQQWQTKDLGDGCLPVQGTQHGGGENAELEEVQKSSEYESVLGKYYRHMGSETGIHVYRSKDGTTVDQRMMHWKFIPENGKQVKAFASERREALEALLGWTGFDDFLNKKGGHGNNTMEEAGENA